LQVVCLNTGENLDTAYAGSRILFENSISAWTNGNDIAYARSCIFFENSISAWTNGNDWL
jgi:hypothetical protein